VAESYLREGARRGCGFCAMRMENSGADYPWTRGDSFHIAMPYLHIKEARAPGESSFSNWNFFQAFSANTGDFVSSVTEGVYFLLLCREWH
jgi:hypothetical protein